MKKIEKKAVIQNIIVFILLPFFLNIVLESLGNKDFFGGIKKLAADPYIFLCNTLIVAFTLSIGAFFRRFRMFWISMVSFCWLALGTVNFFILCNRTLPFTAYDLQMLDTVPLIVRKYLHPYLLAIICLFIVAILLVITAVFRGAISAPKQKHSLTAPAIFVITTFLITSFNIKLAIHLGILETDFPDLKKSFVYNGFAYSFTTSVFDRGIDKPKGYSQKLMDSITDEFDETDKSTVKKPNIIFLQMESFFDVNSLKNVKFSENPVPNFTKLANEYPSGLLTVPVIGAGTANTEFEVATGMRIADFGAGEYPFKTVLTKQACESTAFILEKHGYTSHFIHNYRGAFYGRDTVYANLGYNYFYSVEYMTGFDKNEKGWAKDSILTKYINECLDSTEGCDLITAISVQGHGGYGGISDFERHITVTDSFDESLHLSYEYYVNQVYEMDAFLGELVSSLSLRPEETVLVIYGDHLPALELTTKDLWARNTYQTDYVIWSNTSVEYTDEDLYSYQLSSKVLKSLNISDGIINACHQVYRNDDNYLFNLRALEYDMLYGEKYAFDKKNPYSPSKMANNTRKIILHDISLKSGTEDIYVITGEGFTDKSIVKLEYSILPSTYVDEHTLEIRCKEKNLNKAICVWEKDTGNSNILFLKK